MIKVLNVRPMDGFKLELDFSDKSQGIFDGQAYLASRSGPLLEDLRSRDYFDRVFIDAGALCWPNGLELSPSRVRQLCSSFTTA